MIKRIISSIVIIFVVFILKAQDVVYYENEDMDGGITEPCIDWTNTMYSNFFPQLGNKKKDVFVPNIKTYDQANQSWSNTAMGCTSCSHQESIKGVLQFNKDGSPVIINTGITVNNIVTSTCGIGQVGCLITCQAMILKTFGFNMDPGTWLTYLTNNNGMSGCLLSNFNLMTKYANAQGSHITNDCPLYYGGSAWDATDAAILKWAIDHGGLVILRSNEYYSSGHYFKCPTNTVHFLLIYGYVGDNPAMKDFIVSDPGTSYDNGNTNWTLGGYINLNASTLTLSVGTDGKLSDKPTFHIYFPSGKDIPFIDIPTSDYNAGDALVLNYSPSTSTSTKSTPNIVWTITDPLGQTWVSYLTNPNFVFNSGGSFTITMAMEDQSGFYNDIKTVTVVDNIDPTTGLITDPTSVDNTDWDLSSGSDPGASTIGASPLILPGSSNINGNNNGNNNFCYSCQPYYYYQYTYKPFSYTNNNWYATAMNTSFTIIDNTSYSLGDLTAPQDYNQSYVWNCWDFYGGKCGTFEWDDGEQWAWKTESASFTDCPLGFHDKIVNFKQMYPGHVMEHTYTAEGQYTIRYWESKVPALWEDCTQVTKYFDETWGGANIVDCSATRTSISSALNYDFGWGHSYFAGYFQLNSIPSKYNSMKLILSACNSIELDPGATLAPSGSGNYIQLEVGVIEGSQNSSTKAAYEPVETNTVEIKPIATSDFTTKTSIYPNPTNGSFTVARNSVEPYSVMVYGISGNLVKDIRNCQSNTSFDISGFPGGIYIVKVSGLSDTFTGKLVKN